MYALFVAFACLLILNYFEISYVLIDRDAMWSLCVTCGAWLSLHMWDGITYEIDEFRIKMNNIVDIANTKKLSNTLGHTASAEVFDLVTFVLHSKSSSTEDAIRVFRGVADFFEHYLWRDSLGVYHSGPTTSPENSYRSPSDYLKKQAPSVGATEFITMSPAIDMSILRQVTVQAVSPDLLINQ